MEKRQPPAVSAQPEVQLQVSQNEHLHPSARPTSLFDGNKPQCKTLAAAVLIFTSGGMSLAFGFEFSPQNSDLSPAVRRHMVFSWFVAVIIGACFATAFIERLEKRIFNLWASGLVFINGVFYLSSPGSLLAIVCARYFDGIAVGLTIVSAIVGGSEQAVKRFRGLALSVEFVGLSIGIMLKTMFTSFWNMDWDFKINQMQGILAMTVGGLAMLCTCFLTVESAVFFLRRNEPVFALNSLRRLQVSSDDDENEIHRLLCENESLLKEDTDRGRKDNMKRGYVPLIKLCFYRAFVSMSFSLPLNWGLLEAAALLRGNNNWWNYYLYGTMRLAGVIIAAFTADSAGRRDPTAISMLCAGGLLMGIGSIFNLNDNMVHQTKLQTILALLIVFQLLSGIAAPASTVYLGEAFSISVKPFFILAAVVFEKVIQIIIICTFEYNAKSVADYSYILGGLQMLFAIGFVVIMPETKRTTLREALTKFERRIHVSYYQ